MTIDLKSLGVTKAEVNAALAHEERRWARKRLVALQSICCGNDVWAAAHAARATHTSVRRWLEKVQAGGIAGLLRMNRAYPLHISDEEIAGARSYIEASLAKEKRPWVRVRLVAVGALLSGKTLKAAAKSAGVKPDTVSGWLAKLRRHGCAWFSRDPPATALGLPAVDAQQVATVSRVITRMLMKAPKPCPRSQQRLRAVLLALSGEIGKAAEAAYVRPATVHQWLRDVIQLGPAAVLEKPHPGRPRLRRHTRP